MRIHASLAGTCVLRCAADFQSCMGAWMKRATKGNMKPQLHPKLQAVHSPAAATISGQTAVHIASKSWPNHLQTTQFLGHLLTCQKPLTLAVWLRKMWRERPVPTSNTCRALSLPAATRWEDTQEKATSLMVSMLPCRQAVSAPVEASHRRTFLSVPPLASLLPVLHGTQVGCSPVSLVRCAVQGRVLPRSACPAGRL